MHRTVWKFFLKSAGIKIYIIILVKRAKMVTPQSAPQNFGHAKQIDEILPRAFIAPWFFIHRTSCLSPKFSQNWWTTLQSLDNQQLVLAGRSGIGHLCICKTYAAEKSKSKNIFGCQIDPPDFRSGKKNDGAQKISPIIIPFPKAQGSKTSNPLIADAQRTYAVPIPWCGFPSRV